MNEIPTMSGLVADVRAEVGTLVLDVALSARADEMVAIVGPNGAGKTRLLRMLAGLDRPAGGRVVLDAEVLDDVEAGVHVSAERRSTGFVFQDLALFPHLTVLENVAFGLRALGRDRAGARAAAADWLDRFDLTAHAKSRPAALSTGQAQRVALARALVGDPRLLLLDEPTSSLDVTARAAARRLLSDHVRHRSGVRLLVTHDPVEGLTLADRVVVLEAGRVVQSGTPAEVAAAPRSAYVADLVGVNLLRGTATSGVVDVEGGGRLVVATATSGPVFAVVHPRAVALHRKAPEGSARNVWAGTVTAVQPLGELVRVSVAGPPPLVAEVTPSAVAELALGVGVPVWVSVKATEIAAYPG